MELLALLAVLCVVAVNAIAPRLRLSAPLLLVVVGVIVSVQPFVAAPMIEIEPELVLAGVLPLLLFAAAVSMPATTFRRDLRTITGLSVSLVVISAVTLGFVFAAVLPSLGLAGGIALGAILSPTDAVATSIVKKLGVAPRVVALLDGESMLNDASALVLLRASIAAMASTVSIAGVAGTFLYSIAIATAIGVAVGYLSLRVRRHLHEPTVSTLVSFAVPFVAYQPAEHLGASGLVAVVAAGLVIGHRAPRHLAVAHRMRESINWHTVEMLLEGGLFLLMGLELFALIEDVRHSDDDIGTAAGLAGAALAITLVARALFAVPLLWSVRRRRLDYEAWRERLNEMKADFGDAATSAPGLAAREVQHVTQFRARVRRVLADADYLSSRPLGARDGVLLVWAGMRGAITLAAAHTLPADVPHRSLLVLVAFLVATASLLLQGGTLGWVIRRLGFPPEDPAVHEQERTAILAEVDAAALAVLDDPALRRPDGTPYDPAVLASLRPRVIRSRREDREAAHLDDLGPLIERVFHAQRTCILDARSDGVYSSEVLAAALARVDAVQLGMQLAKPRGPAGD